MTESELREKLRKIERLFAGAASSGEREAAGDALQRIRERIQKMDTLDPPVEYRFAIPDHYSRILFIALLRRYGIEPYRRPRQKRQSIMARVSRRFVDETLWPEYQELNQALRSYLLGVTEDLIRREIHADVHDPDVPSGLPSN